jgi:hypothetical protein
MSTISSVLLVVNYFIYIVSKNDTTAAYAGGIVAMIVLLIGNIVYFITAYYAYTIFEEKFFEKLGAKESMHRMYKWIQFNNTALKADFGFCLIFCLTSYLFFYELWYYLIIDTIIAIGMGFSVYYMRAQLRNENARNAYIILGVRCAVQAYLIFRTVLGTIYYQDKVSDETNVNDYRGCLFILAGTSKNILF